MIKIDLHCHSCWSPDCDTSLDDIVRSTVRAGVDVLALTDHNEIEGALRLRRIAPFCVIVGEEIMTSEGEIIGLYLTRLVPPHLSPEDTLDHIHRQGGLAYVPHPCDSSRVSTLSSTALNRNLSSIDVLEVMNGKCSRRFYNLEAEALALRWGALIGAGSDAHTANEIGRCGVEASSSIPSSTPEMLQMLRASRIFVRPSV